MRINNSKPSTAPLSKRQYSAKGHRVRAAWLSGLLILALAMTMAMTMAMARTAKADTVGVDFREFKASVDSFRAACAKHATCVTEVFDVRKLYDGVSKDPSINPVFRQLHSIAGSQIQIWADTILEDEFVTEGRLRLDHVLGIYQDGQLIAYRLIYSQKAWRVDGHGMKEEEGRITEATYASPTLESWIRDDDAFARFN